MLFPTLYTAGSILWYSTRGLFISSSQYTEGDTNVFKFLNGNKKALILLHGLSGTGDSGYIKYAHVKLKGHYDIYAPEYGTSEKHLYPTYLPVADDPVFARDVITLYRKLIKEYDQVSFIAFSAGGGAMMQILNLLKLEDVQKLESAFFVSPALKLKEGFEYLETVWFPVRLFMKYDYFGKFFTWIAKKDGYLAATKFLLKCRTFDDVFKYFSKDGVYPVIPNTGIGELDAKFVLLHPDDDPIVEAKMTLAFVKGQDITRIKQLTGGHIGFSAMDRCIRFYTDDEIIPDNEISNIEELNKK